MHLLRLKKDVGVHIKNPSVEGSEGFINQYSLCTEILQVLVEVNFHSPAVPEELLFSLNDKVATLVLQGLENLSVLTLDKNSSFP